MSKIAELLDPTVAQKMQAVVADIQPSQPAKPKRVLKGRAGEVDIVITKASTEPNQPARHHPICKCEGCEVGTSVAMTPEAYAERYGLVRPTAPRTLTAADAIDIDPRSGAMIEAECVDCHTPLLIDPEVPEGVDPEAPRIPICAECAGIRVRHEAMNNQRSVQAIRRPRVAHHQPRTSDGIDHPVKTTKKENDMDLDNLSDAELGAVVRQQMKATKVEQVKAAKPVVEAERKVKEKKEKKGVKASRVERRKVLAGFMVGTTLEIPDLDLSEVASLDEAPSAKERSPYNKARFRLTKEAPLDPEETTYRTLAEEHERLRKTEAERVGKAKEAKPKKVTAIVADVQDVDKAKVKALAKVLGISKKEARKLVEARS